MRHLTPCRNEHQKDTGTGKCPDLVEGVIHGEREQQQDQEETECVNLMAVMAELEEVGARSLGGNQKGKARRCRFGLKCPHLRKGPDSCNSFHPRDEIEWIHPYVRMIGEDGSSEDSSFKDKKFFQLVTAEDAADGIVEVKKLFQLMIDWEGQDDMVLRMLQYLDVVMLIEKKAVCQRWNRLCGTVINSKRSDQ